MTFDDDPRKLDEDALLNQLGVKPTDDRPRAQFDQHFLDGSAAGQDMSWMKQPGSTTGVGVSPDLQAPTSNTLPVSGNALSVTPERTPMQASVFQGFTPKHAMEGFAFDREQNTGKSAKDAFAALANQAPPPPTQDKAALAQWFTQYIAPGMNDLGHKVSNVEGDKFRLDNWQGGFDVDYGRGAGADGGALAWQVDDGTAQMSNGAYTPQATAPSVPMDVNGPSAQDAIMAEVEALINGGNSQMDERALMELLQGAQI
jgi:hypothetical protein